MRNLLQYQWLTIGEQRTIEPFGAPFGRARQFASDRTAYNTRAVSSPRPPFPAGEAHAFGLGEIGE